MKALFVAISLASSIAFAQSPPGKTTEQQARSYIVSAFMTGAAPMVISEDATITPDARQRLGVSATSDTRTVYDAIVGASRGTPPTARTPTPEEVAKSGAPQDPGKPLFAVEAGDTTLVVQYDLQRDAISFVGQPGGPVAVATPVAQPPAPEKVPDTPPPAAEAPKPAPAPVPEPVVVEAPKPGPVPEPVVVEVPEPAPVPAPVVEAPKPAPAPAAEPQASAPQAPAPQAPAPQAPAPQVVEPREPRVAKPAPAAPKPAPVQAARSAEPRVPPPPQLPRLRPSGPCVIKPVMSDQDLVNCGATPR